MLQFHDWLRGNAGDRRLYERVKRELTGQAWASVQQYADARTAVIGAILAGHTAPTHCRKRRRRLGQRTGSNRCP